MPRYYANDVDKITQKRSLKIPSNGTNEIIQKNEKEKTKIKS